MVYVLFAIHNRKQLTLDCLQHLYRQKGCNLEVVVFDDGSTDKSAEAISTLFPSTKVLFGDGSYFWSKSMNRGLRYIMQRAGPSDFVLLLNDDTRFDDDYVCSLKEISEKNARALVGSIVRNSSNPTQVIDAGYRIDWKDYRISRLSYSQDVDHIEVDTLSARGVLVPIEVFQRIGIFAERSLPHYAADLEFSIRAKSHGFKLLMSYKAIIYDREPKVDQPKTFSERLFSLFKIKSADNLLNHLYIIFRHSPRFVWALKNATKLVLIRLRYLLGF